MEKSLICNDAFNRPFLHSLHLPKGMICIIGSGGKTTFLRYLASQLDGTVILTTSTHIYPFRGIPLLPCKPGVQSESANELRHQIEKMLSVNNLLCLGTLESNGKLSAPPIPFAELLPLADYVLVEADGSAGRPLKAHRPTEPVIPECSSKTICIIGAAGIGKPIRDVVHCPDLFCRLADAHPDDTVREEHIARVINTENLADLYLLNQTDLLPDRTIADRVCALIHKCAYPLSLDSSPAKPD